MLAFITFNPEFPWPYNLYMDLFMLFLIFAIGIPTIYAMIFGAPWVPTPILAVRKMLKLANLKSGDIVYDLGCGDGRLVIEASKTKGVKGIGYEISPIIYIFATIRNLIFGFKAKILFKTFWNKDLSDANVIFIYLLPKAMEKLVKKFKKELKPGTKIISYAFELKELDPVKTIEKDRGNNLCRILVYEIKGKGE